MTVTMEESERVNGLDVDALRQTIAEVAEAPAKGLVEFRVRSAWQGQTRSVARVDGFRLAGETVERQFDIAVDEPFELLGTDTAPNPQELLMAALNACMMVGYVAGAAMKGIALEMLEIETDGALDLRGFLGIDPAVAPGYEAIRYTVRIKGNGSDEDFREIHETVMKTSPNYFNLSRPIRLESDLVIED